MISSLSWVRQAAVKAKPVQFELSEEEAKAFLGMSGDTIALERAHMERAAQRKRVDDDDSDAEDGDEDEDEQDEDDDQDEDDEDAGPAARKEKERKQGKGALSHSDRACSGKDKGQEADIMAKYALDKYDADEKPVSEEQEQATRNVRPSGDVVRDAVRIVMDRVFTDMTELVVSDTKDPYLEDADGLVGHARARAHRSMLHGYRQRTRTRMTL